MSLDLEDRLQLRFEGLSLTFSYGEAAAHGPDRIDGLVRMDQEQLHLVYHFTCRGADLLLFSRALRDFHSRLHGEAWFEGTFDPVRLGLSVADRGAGCVSARIEMEHITFTPDLKRQLLEFSGFFVEQSYLPGMAGDIDLFLEHWAIPTDPAWGP